MRKLAVYLEGYRRQAVLAPLFKLLEALMDLFVPLVVARIIDVGIAGNERPAIIHGFILMLALAAVGLGFSITAQYFAARASVGFATKLRQSLFDHVQGLSYTELDTLGTNTLITRMTSDVNQVQNGLNMSLRLLLRSPFIVFGSMILAFTIDVKCALIFAVAIPVLSVVVYGIMLASIPLFRKVQAGLDQVLGLTRENLTGVRVIRAFCKEDDEVREFDDRNEALTKMNLFVGRLSALMNPATYFLINLATIFLIRQGAIQVNIGRIGQGEVVALYNYMAQMIVELIKLASLIITINKAIACADRVESVLEVQSSMAFSAEAKGNAGREAGYEEAAMIAVGATDMAAGTVAETESGAASQAVSGGDGSVTQLPTQAAKDTEQSIRHGSEEEESIRFNHVSFRYQGAGAESVSDLDFAVQRGQTVGIIGGTGSGKSTLVSLIPRFYDATKGTVMVNGRNVRDYAEEELRSLVGVVPQRAVLFKGTIRDNMKWGNENSTDEEIWQALTTAQAREVVEGKDGQLDFMIGQNGRNLSGGQKQRLTIARALVKHPEILIMDDSASALDFATDAALRKAIRGLNALETANPMTVVIVSQRTSSIMNADLILVLSDGQIVGKGTHEELMKTCGIYQEIFYSQFPEKRSGGAAGKIPGDTDGTGDVADVADDLANDFSSGFAGDTAKDEEGLV